jgi:hypothetical protein
MHIANLCRHIMPTGRTCQAFAKRGSAYCYYHGPDKAQRRSALKPKAAEDELEFPPLVDNASVVGQADQIVRALGANRISTGRAAVLLQGLQTVLASWRLPPVDEFDENFDPEYDFAEALKARIAAHAAAQPCDPDPQNRL